MNRSKFTFTIFVFGSLVSLIITLFFIVTKGIPEGNVLPYIWMLLIPGSLSSFISAHILFRVIENKIRTNKKIWLGSLFIVLLAYVLFGLISTIAVGYYEPYKAFRNIQSYLIMSAVMGGMGFITTSWLSIPLGLFGINKFIGSNKKFNMDSGVNAPPPVN